jgi:GntR family transcriptional regulator/MocR family aminotransferase
MAIFLAEGHFDAHIRRQRASLSAKWKAVLKGAERHLTDCDVTMTTGGSAIWVQLPEHLNARAVEREAAKAGVLVEAGDVHYLRPDAPTNRLRLGFAAIAQEKIDPGLALLAKAMKTMARCA